MFVFIDNYNLSIRQDHLNLDEIIDAQPAQPTLKTESAEDHDRRSHRMRGAATAQLNTPISPLIRYGTLTMAHGRERDYPSPTEMLLLKDAPQYTYQSPSVEHLHQMSHTHVDGLV